MTCTLDRPATNRKRHFSGKLFARRPEIDVGNCYCYFITPLKEKHSIVRRSASYRPCLFSFHSDMNLGDEIIKPKQDHRAEQMLLSTHPYTVDFCLAKLSMVFQAANRITSFDNFCWTSAVKIKTLRWQKAVNRITTAKLTITALSFSVFQKKRGLPWEIFA